VWGQLATVHGMTGCLIGQHLSAKHWGASQWNVPESLCVVCVGLMSLAPLLV
jgi:hypothetical protein